ncbi:thymidine kinase [Weissella oryzae SG25]|uniref:Thymidine kinase n=1 Tax=Weissella oryzae (strain DSM 25784 / JCM 18191 / LMG 30913 / SG25) TaxID=1329250 RepID=A0A069CUK9_WEIOS|nr:DUF2075 domain-containing protein [Weissella oryzae]GAK31490.1 thymidine kinase [Weissella oryzae SG25]
MENSAKEKFNVTDLSYEQVQQLQAIEQYVLKGLTSSIGPNVAVIEGSAGVGKSVILTKLFQRLKQHQQINSIFTVNHPDLLKVYQSLASDLPGIKQKDYVRPTSLINAAHKNNQQYDVILVDEGHLLLSKAEPYIRFKQDNQLAELIKLAKVVVVVFDFHQMIQTKMLWTPTMLKQVLAPYTHQTFKLDVQYRMQAPQAVLTWLKNLAQGAINPFPVFENYDLRIFDRASEMYTLIKQRNQSEGLARMVATTGFTRQAGRHNVHMDDFDLPWDEYDGQKTPWAERSDTINEVGSIYTVQGFDLNYVGVILGPPFEYDAKNDRITVNPDKVTHREIYKKHPAIMNEHEFAEIKQTVMFNALNILLTRGIKGTYLTAADDKLRERLLQLNHG